MVLDMVRSLAFACFLTLLCSNNYLWAFEKNDKLQGHILNFGTASKSGIYWPVGKGICDLMNDNRQQTGVHCNIFNTGGSVYNINAIMGGSLDIAIVRSDVATKAYMGLDTFKSQDNFDDLRFVTALYEQPVTILMKDYLNAESIDDLEGKRIALNPIGSGQRRHVELLLAAAEIEFANIEIVEMTTPKMPQAFCNDEIDVVIQSIAHPSQYYQELLDDCDGKILGLSVSDVQKIKKVDERIQEIILNKELYESLSSSLKTYGYQAILVSTISVPEKTIQGLIDVISSDFRRFFNIHPALAPYKTQQLGRGDLKIPVHPGAKDFHLILDALN
jgi:uncharacterized protein